MNSNMCPPFGTSEHGDFSESARSLRAAGRTAVCTGRQMVRASFSWLERHSGSWGDWASGSCLLYGSGWLGKLNRFKRKGNQTISLEHKDFRLTFFVGIAGRIRGRQRYDGSREGWEGSFIPKEKTINVHKEGHSGLCRSVQRSEIPYKGGSLRRWQSNCLGALGETISF